MTRPVRDDAGYYDTPEGRLLSVTTIIGLGTAKQHELVPWVAKEVATAAIEYRHRLAAIPDDDTVGLEKALAWLKLRADDKRDRAANLGTRVHDAVEADVLETPYVAGEAEQVFLDGFRNFCADWQPDFEAAELTVANYEHGYAGTLDMIVRCPRLVPYIAESLGIPEIDADALLLGDTKSGRGVYSEAGLQMSAYQRAKVGWLRDGTRVEVPQAEAAFVLHLKRPTSQTKRGYRIRPCRTDAAVFGAFLNTKRNAEDWVLGVSRTVLGKAIMAPAEVA